MSYVESNGNIEVAAAHALKTVTPQGQVVYGDALTYTLVITAKPGDHLSIYDLLDDTTLTRFVEQPPGITSLDLTSGTLRLGSIITGTLTVTPTNQITVSFVVHVGISGTETLPAYITNQAYICLVGGTDDDCAWSNQVRNLAFLPYAIYLPVILREH